MAILGQLSEDKIRRYLQDWFAQEFSPKKLKLQTGTGIEEHEFDAVSEDGKVVAEVKALTHPEYPNEMQLAREDVALLHFANTERKLLFLTDPIFYIVFCRTHRDVMLEWKKMGIQVVSPFELNKYLEA